MFLFFGAVSQNIMRDDPATHAYPGAEPTAKTRARKLLRDDRLMAEVTATAAIFLRNADAEKSRFTELPPCPRIEPRWSRSHCLACGNNSFFTKAGEALRQKLKLFPTSREMARSGPFFY